MKFKNIKKIGVISDNHGDEIPLGVLNKFEGVDLIIHCGDCLDLKTLEQLKMVAPVVAVVGNMDGQDVGQELQQKIIVEIDNSEIKDEKGIDNSNKTFKIGVTHGYGAPDDLWKRVKAEFDDDIQKFDALLFGHSHTPFNETMDEVLYFNPGSVTDKKYAKINAIGIIEVGEKLVGKIVQV